MYQTQINISETAYRKLLELSSILGKKEEEVASMAVLEYKLDLEKLEKMVIFNQAKGLWKDRDDLPDFEALRKEWDRGYNE